MNYEPGGEGSISTHHPVPSQLASRKSKSKSYIGTRDAECGSHLEDVSRYISIYLESSRIKRSLRVTHLGNIGSGLPRVGGRSSLDSREPEDV